MAVMEETERTTPTGLVLADLTDLDRAAKVAVARWQDSVAGRDAGMAFVPRAIRRLSIEQRLALALDAGMARAWEVRERARVKASVHYFVSEYGSVQPEEGPAIPFDLWPEQNEVLDAMLVELRLLILKARQLGLTWLALHYGFWRMAFDPISPKFRVLALSKKGTDADELIDRARAINDRLPPYLRQAESRATRESNSRFRLLERGSEMRSLMGTVDAARSFTAGLAILDELGFYRNGQASGILSAVQPTLGEKGQAFGITTGNGTTGDGQAAAETWQGSQDGSSKFVGIFLRSDVHPARRAPNWRAEKRKEYLTDEDFEAEFPETPDQALAGKGSYRVYPPSAIAAAMRLGTLLEEHLPELVEANGVEWGIDWGDFQTFAVYAVGLPGGGVFIFDELVLPHTEPGKAAEQIIYRDPHDLAGCRFVASYADKAPVGTNRTFSRVLREAHDADPNRWPSKHVTIPFGVYKEGGGDRAVSGDGKKGGVNTVAFIRSLLEGAEGYTGPADEASGVIALSPRLVTLPAQMRNLERDADTGKVRKPALDPRHVERGDHGPDACVALMAARAKGWRVRD